MVGKKLPIELVRLQMKVEEVARGYGLNMFETCYEMLDFDEINMLASYMGFPVRYPHWKWGMEYERLSKSHEYGLNKIYEMVINNDPCYAFLQESNSFVDQKIVMCHVSGHNDFFKSNYAFQHSNRKMIDAMANHASRIRRYMDWYGVDVVEGFIDRVLSLENLIDYKSSFVSKKKGNFDESEHRVDKSEKIAKIPYKHEYMENYVNPEAFVQEQRNVGKEQAKKESKFPKEPVYDVLQFLMAHAPLAKWQADVIEMLREESYYFAPQAMTKIMNEGWASYWHAKLMTEKVMDSTELIDFADRHSGVVATSASNLNPYKLGMELFRDIEDRWNKGQFGRDFENCDEMKEIRRWDKKLGLGRDKIFQVRKIYDDVTFIDEFFTLDFCKRLGFFSSDYDKKRQEFVIDSRDFEKIKKKLLSSLTNLGHPKISIVDANYENRAELLLQHVHDGVDLDIGYGLETIKNLHGIWTRPVNLITKVDDRDIFISYDGENFKEKLLTRQI